MLADEFAREEVEDPHCVARCAGRNVKAAWYGDAVLVVDGKNLFVGVIVDVISMEPEPVASVKAEEVGLFEIRGTVKAVVTVRRPASSGSAWDEHLVHDKSLGEKGIGQEVIHLT